MKEKRAEPRKPLPLIKLCSYTTAYYAFFMLLQASENTSVHKCMVIFPK